MENFLSEEEFSEASKSQQGTIIPWRDVPQNVIYKIEDMEEITTKGEEAKVISLVDAEGEKIKAFTTSILDRDLVDFNWGSSCYIKSLGLKESSSEGRSYYKYELVKQDY